MLLCRYSKSLKLAPVWCCIYVVFASLTASAATLVYYDGTNNGTTVTNLGTLGSVANGIVTTAGTGVVSFQTTGGPNGVADSFVSVASTDSNGGWVTVPTGSLNSFQNSSWSVSGSFNRTANTNGLDMIVHFGSGDGSGSESELYLQGLSGNNNVRAEHFPGPDVTTASASLSLGAWHTYAMTFQASGLNDSTGILSLYLNGSLIGTDNSFTLANMAQTLQWGGTGYVATSTTAGRGFTGGLDNFAFYDTVLSSVDVTALNNGTLNPLTVPEPGRAILRCFGFLLMMGRRRRRAF